MSEIGYQGVRGSFSEQAAIARFNHEGRCYPSFEDVFLAIDSGEIEFGVLPIENSYAGSVCEVYDLMRKYGFFIESELLLPITENLLGAPGATIESIKTVYSHPQGLAQCAAYLNRHPGITAFPCANTAVAAQMVRDAADPSLGALSSLRAAQIYGLNVIEERVNDRADNNTRFIVVSREFFAAKDADKASVMFFLENRAGALAAMLLHFAVNGVNMTKIESRPVRERPWQYVFYCDLEGDYSSPGMKRAIQAANREAQSFRLLGVYRKAV